MRTYIPESVIKALHNGACDDALAAWSAWLEAPQGEGHLDTPSIGPADLLMARLLSYSLVSHDSRLDQVIANLSAHMKPTVV